MDKKLTNKRLVRYLMDTRGVKSICITDKVVCVQFHTSFTPAKAEELCKQLGQTDFKAVRRNQENYIVFKRF